MIPDEITYDDNEGIHDSHPCPCPYYEEINNDHENKCNCCEECQYQCTMDI